MSNNSIAKKIIFQDVIKTTREFMILSQAEFAAKLGVSRLTITRWENGDSEPTPLALNTLVSMADGLPTHSSLLEYSHSHANNQSNDDKLRTFKYGKEKWSVLPAPYVTNSPEDQNEFNELLIEIQSVDKPSVDSAQYKKRLSMIYSVDGEKTAQSILENRIKTAKSWSSNYGPHGWHRYVGRFPSHLVRALINYFQADENDIILDPFAGSGTTLLEARMLGVPSIGIEVCSLSSLITKTKAGFPKNASSVITGFLSDLEDFYNLEWDKFVKKVGPDFVHSDILSRKTNMIDKFTNIEKWFSPSALLGSSIIVEFADKQKGFAKDAILVALSAKMRSIGNLDVDVIRAEYRKTPRENVDVLKLVKRQLMSMSVSIDDTLKSHAGIISEKPNIKVIEGSVLDAKIEKGSISFVITSPPYGVESLSYLRTHLLSYRSLVRELKTNPNDSSDKIIGSEYLAKNEVSTDNLKISKASKSCIAFFNDLSEKVDKKNKIRVNMMIHFFEDMNSVVEKLAYWVKDGGKVAFIVGNKRIGSDIIPTHTIIQEIFEYNGFTMEKEIKQKLKTNNSNSKVPWQDRIIDEEYILIFRKDPK